MEKTTAPDCPRCDYSSADYIGCRTERWGCIVDIESFSCPNCSFTFEKEA